MNKNSSTFLAYISATLYAAIVSLSFLTVKTGLKYAHPTDLLAFRFTCAFIAILITLSFRLTRFRLTRKKFCNLAPLALFYPILYFGFQSFGLNYTTSVEAGIMNALIPVLTLVLATIFLKEKTSVLQKLSIILSVMGVVYITLKNGSESTSNNLAGIILLFASSLSFSFYSVLVKKRSEDFSTSDISFMVTILGFVFFNMLSIVNHIRKGTLSEFFEPLNKTSFIWAILYLGVLSTLFTSLLANYALSKIRASEMNVFVNLATVLSIFAGAVFLNEKIHHHHIIGSVLIVLGVLGANFLGKSRTG